MQNQDSQDFQDKQNFGGYPWGQTLVIALSKTQNFAF